MFGLLISTIVTSAADSLNPIAITQQFVLQGMVKKPKHIWYFILSIAITNLAGGFLAYFGLLTFLNEFIGILLDRHGQILFTFELILGIAFLIGVGYFIQNTKIESLKNQIRFLNANESKRNEEEAIAHKIKSVSPTSLVVLGVGATISELTTALPYFAFLAILFNYRLSFVQVTFILLVYNIIYSLPLILLYFLYIKAQNKFDRLYGSIKIQMSKWAGIIAPTLIGIVGIFLVFHSTSLLLK